MKKVRRAELWKRLRAVYYIFSLSYGRSDEYHRDGLQILRTHIGTLFWQTLYLILIILSGFYFF